MHPDILKKKLLPAVIGAVLSLVFLKSGFLFLFFLVPLGVLAYRYDREVAWMGLLLAVLGSAAMAISTAAAKNLPLAELSLDFLYFLSMSSLFMLICAPPKGFIRSIPGALRLIAGSSIAAVIITVMIWRTMAAPGFLEFLDSWINALASVNRSDVMRLAVLEAMNAEQLRSMMKAIMIRGGSLGFCVFMFFICRQLGVTLARFGLKGSNRANGAGPSNFLFLFHVYPQVIWIFSFSLMLVVLTKLFNLLIPEILVWNVLLICVMLYLAQGLGIFQFFLTKPSTPGFLKFFLGIAFIFLLFSPVINAVLMGGLILLGIIENWVPLRAPKKNGPPSTPEAGREP